MLRIALLPVDPKPEPRYHDEFSYIFGGETFAKGRLANPTHPMWRFFETYHINMQPTYVSKYPPAQALFLALGIRIFGHPWYGVLLSVALMCASICWMLQGWLPPKYALFGGCLAVLQFGAGHYWMDSYWGGAVAGTGGALVVGCLPRLVRAPKTSTAFAAAAGIAILANSRPFEGLVLLILVSLALAIQSRGHKSGWIRPGILIPLLSALCATGGAMAFYNVKTTGNATTFPYTLNQQQYSASPIFWILPPHSSEHRRYRDESMRDFWEKQDVDVYKHPRHNPSTMVFHLSGAMRDLFGAGAGIGVVFLILCAIPLTNRSRVRFLVPPIAIFLAVLSLDKYVFAHYLAPLVGALFVTAMFGFRLLRAQRIKRHQTGLALVGCLTIFTAVLCVFDTVQSIRKRSVSDGSRIVAFRPKVAKQLSSDPGMHLILVRYATGHDASEEIVYNSPDIDAQKIIWAFDFGLEADRPLLNYYRGRKVWLVQPDGANPTIEPYSGT